MEPSFQALLPPLLALTLAFWTRRISLSLLCGIWIGTMLLASGHPLAGTVAAVQTTLAVALEPSNARLLSFCLLIGPLVVFLEVSGGVAGFVRAVEQRQWVQDARSARLLAWLVGIVVFIETNITLLVTGAICRPLFARHGESREKLAYLADSTSAPVCILIPFNAWGALVLGLLQGQNVHHPLTVFMEAVPLNFYAVAAVLLAGLAAWSGWSPGAMRRAASSQADLDAVALAQAGTDSARRTPSPGGRVPEARLEEAREVAPQPALLSGEVFSTPAGFGAATDRAKGDPGTGHPAPRALNMLLPLLVLILVMPLTLVITGHGSLVHGSGSLSALTAVLAGNMAACLLMLLQRRARPLALLQHAAHGVRSLLGMVLILLLAITLGKVCTELGTGPFIAGLLSGVARPVFLLPATFLVGAVVSFATGTSWGTFAMTIPMVVPAAAALGLPLGPFLAACLSGGIFGDHASPLSDTSVVASLAAGCGVLDHVRTQMPYALLAAGLSLLAFAVTGALL